LKSKRITSIVSVFLLILIACTHFCLVKTLHLHLLDNGFIIVHAHPFDSPDDTGARRSHHHSQLDLIVFNDFINTAFSPVENSPENHDHPVIEITSLEDEGGVTHICPWNYPDLRAPPLSRL